MKDLLVRPAQAEDISEILALLGEFAEYEKLLDTFEVTEERLRIALFGETKVAEAIVAVNDKRMLGYAIFFPYFATFRGQRGIYLEDIYISEEFRGRGVGEIMLKQIAKTAKQRGFERIDFQVFQWNAAAIGFYEKLGAERNEEERHFKFAGEAFENLAL